MMISVDYSSLRKNVTTAIIIYVAFNHKAVAMILVPKDAIMIEIRNIYYYNLHDTVLVIQGKLVPKAKYDLD